MPRSLNDVTAPAAALPSVPAGLTRRAFIVGVPLVLAACTEAGPGLMAEGSGLTGVDPSTAMLYAARPDTRFPLDAVDLTRINPTYLRREVALPANIPDRPNSIVVDPRNRFLYYVEPGGRATRYGTGVGREGFAWNGAATIQRKQDWPTWTPPPAMVRRDPSARPWAAGMPGGPTNPLGARAMYLYRDGRDTLYRIHGTNQPWTIGTAASSGCIRMLNHDVVHLYERVSIGTRVTVLAA